jgi:hypothetical protein
MTRLRSGTPKVPKKKNKKRAMKKKKRRRTTTPSDSSAPHFLFGVDAKGGVKLSIYVLVEQ